MHANTRVGVLAGLLVALTLTGDAHAAPTWTSPASVYEQRGFDLYDAQVAAAPSGEVVAVAQAYNTDYDSADIVYAVRPPGGPWGAAKTLTSTPVGRYAYNPALAVDGEGSFLAVWDEDTASGHASSPRPRRRPARTASAPPRRSSATIAGQPASDPALAMNAGGAAAVAWTRGSRIEATARDSRGEPFDAATTFPLDNAAHDTDGPVDVAIDSAGDAIAIWTYNGAASTHSARTARRAAGGAWGGTQTFGSDVSQPRVALAPDGSATAIWQEGGEIRFAVRGVTPSFAGAAFGASGLASQNGVASSNPELAAGPGNAAVAAWSAVIGGNQVVQAATRPSGGSFGGYRTLSGPGSAAFAPQVAMNRSGDAAIVWSDQAIQGAYRPARRHTRRDRRRGRAARAPRSSAPRRRWPSTTTATR